MKLYDTVHALTASGAVTAAYALDGKGLAAAASKMAFGNRLGVSIKDAFDEKRLFTPGFGDILAEVCAGREPEVRAAFEAAGLLEYVTEAGEVNDKQAFLYKTMDLSMDEVLAAWTGTDRKSVV